MVQGLSPSSLPGSQIRFPEIHPTVVLPEVVDLLEWHDGSRHTEKHWITLVLQEERSCTRMQAILRR